MNRPATRLEAALIVGAFLALILAAVLIVSYAASRDTHTDAQLGPATSLERIDGGTLVTLCTDAGPCYELIVPDPTDHEVTP